MSTPFSKRTVSISTESVKRDWILIDATDKVLGRLATETAKRLRGKHKPEYTPHSDTGDYVVVINAEKIRVTGKKAEQKEYLRHTGYPGGLKSKRFDDMQKEHPERIIEFAVKGMLPRTPLGREMLRKLKVYAGNEHPHSAQQPRTLELTHLNSEG